MDFGKEGTELFQRWAGLTAKRLLRASRIEKEESGGL